MIYAAVAGLASVIPQVFWPEAPAWAQKAVPESCVEGLRQLRQELVDRASSQVATGGSASDRALDRWFERWDARFLALEPHCATPGESDAYALLNQLRHRMGTSLQRFDSQEGSLDRKLDRKLRRLSARSSGE